MHLQVWICFSPVAHETQQFYKVKALVVDFLSLSFMAASIPFGPVASWLLDTHGLFKSVLLAAALNCLGGWLRYVSTYWGGLGLLFTGQIIAAAAQPVILDCPTMLAGTWFGENERAVANMVASVSNPVGIALGSFFPPMLVSSVDVNDFRNLYFYFALPATLALCLVAFVFQDKPPHPPSASASAVDHDGFMVRGCGPASEDMRAHI